MLVNRGCPFSIRGHLPQIQTLLDVTICFLIYSLTGVYKQVFLQLEIRMEGIELGPEQMKIMRVLWQKKRATAQDIRVALNESGPDKACQRSGVAQADG